MTTRLSADVVVVGAGPVGGLEDGDDLAGLLRTDSEWLAQEEMVGEVAMETPPRVGCGSDVGLDQSVVAVVPGECEVDGPLGMM